MPGKGVVNALNRVTSPSLPRNNTLRCDSSRIMAPENLFGAYVRRLEIASATVLGKGPLLSSPNHF